MGISLHKNWNVFQTIGTFSPIPNIIMGSIGIHVVSAPALAVNPVLGRFLNSAQVCNGMHDIMNHVSCESA